MNVPGRPKGTKVTQCGCGRRLAGLPEQTIKCPDCGKGVKVPSVNKKAAKRVPVFLTAKKE